MKYTFSRLGDMTSVMMTSLTREGRTGAFLLRTRLLLLRSLGFEYAAIHHQY